MNATIASTHTHVGAAPPGYNQGWVTHTVHWHGFPSLSTLRGVGVASHEFMLLGNQWHLELHPGGDDNAAEGMTSLFLYNKSNKGTDAEYGFSINDGNWKQVAYKRAGTPRNFGPVGTGTSIKGFTNFAERTTLLSSLVNGTAIIEVRMKLATPTKSVPQPFIPENPVIEMIQGLFLDEKYSDIVFEVGADKGKNSAMKVAKTAPVTFSAHQSSLRIAQVYLLTCVNHTMTIQVKFKSMT